MADGRLVARLTPVAQLSRSRIDQMWCVFDAHYADVTRSRFEDDLAAKEEVILLLDGDHVGGFSTLQVMHGTHEGRPFAAVYSGDTVIEPAYWGQSALQRAFFAKVVRTRLRYPGRPVYWFLISKGYKTYLLLVRNFPNSWPRHDSEMPAAIAAVLDQLATRKFGTAWKKDRGVLVFDEPLGRLRVGLASPEGVDDPDAQFFVTHNPGHAEGEEMCCIGIIDLAFARKFIGKHVARALGRRPSRSPPASQAAGNPQ